MKTHVSHSLDETSRIAGEWLNDLTNARSSWDQAAVVGLSGHLGAGKTAFTKTVAKHLGIAEEITSPTFVIMKIYETNPLKELQQWRRLIHIDAYRLERREELEALGFEKLVSDPHNLIMIEWPENVGLGRDDAATAGLSNHLEFEVRGGGYVLNFR